METTDIKKYSFQHISNCNMCGDATEQHKILGKRLNKSQGLRPQKKTGLTISVCKCSNCGLIYSNPQPIPNNIQDHYGVPVESYWKEEYFKIDENYFIGEISILKTLIDTPKGLKVLDIGAGIGKCMIALENAGFDAYGLEPSVSFYQKAIDKMKISPDKLKLGKIEELEYPENYFDFITFSVVLEHLYDPSFCIQRALKWLKPGGIIHIEVPSSKYFMNKLYNAAYAIRGLDYVGNLSPMHTPFHLYEFGINSFILNSKKHNSGYTIPLHQYYSCETGLPNPFNYLLKKYMSLTVGSMQLCVWLKKA